MIRLDNIPSNEDLAKARFLKYSETYCGELLCCEYQFYDSSLGEEMIMIINPESSKATVDSYALSGYIYRKYEYEFNERLDYRNLEQSEIPDSVREDYASRLKDWTSIVHWDHISQKADRMMDVEIDEVTNEPKKIEPFILYTDSYKAKTSKGFEVEIYCSRNESNCLKYVRARSYSSVLGNYPIPDDILKDLSQRGLTTTNITQHY